jgi:type IV secretion system protein VirB8
MTEVVPLQPDTAACDWYADRYQSIFVSRNRWLVVALLALGLALAQALALVGLMPLKTSVPFVIKEEVSGAITTVAPLKGDNSILYEESTRKYFLARYVISRETYDPAGLAEDYTAVGLMSDREEAQEFERSIAQTNPHSPIRVYGQTAKRLIRVKSISFLNDHLAQVRLSATEKNRSGTQAVSEWVALVGFRFGLAPALESDRLINPLGFYVTSYRLDQEVVQ